MKHCCTSYTTAMAGTGPNWDFWRVAEKRITIINVPAHKSNPIHGNPPHATRLSVVVLGPDLTTGKGVKKIQFTSLLCQQLVSKFIDFYFVMICSRLFVVIL